MAKADMLAMIWVYFVSVRPLFWKSLLNTIFCRYMESDIHIHVEEGTKLRIEAVGADCNYT